MGLEEVKKEILEKANQQSKEILKQAKEEEHRILSETKGQIKEYKDQVDQDTKKFIENMERKEKASAEFEVKKMKLDKKKEIVDKVFANVKETLRNMPENQREKYLRALFQKASKEIKVACINANQKDRNIISRMKSAYKESDIIGGIIAENADSSIIVDYSYEEMLDSIEKENMQEIAEKLFAK